MTTVTVHHVNAFSHQGYGGNPAGVVLAADALSSAQKQAIVRAASFSESTAMRFHSPVTTGGHKPGTDGRSARNPHSLD